MLSGFIQSSKLQALAEEAAQVAPATAHRSFNRTNPYFTEDNIELSPEDPRRRFYDRSNAFVPADNFGEASALRAIYEFAGFQTFIKDTLQADHFYRYADPLADVIINLVEEGEGFPWHFDTNNFTVTLAIANGNLAVSLNMRRTCERPMTSALMMLRTFWMSVLIGLSHCNLFRVIYRFFGAAIPFIA